MAVNWELRRCQDGPTLAVGPTWMGEGMGLIFMGLLTNTFSWPNLAAHGFGYVIWANPNGLHTLHSLEKYWIIVRLLCI